MLCYPVVNSYSRSIPQKQKEQGSGGRYGGGGFILWSPHQIKRGILAAVCEAAREASGIKSCDIFISDQT